MKSNPVGIYEKALPRNMDRHRRLDTAGVMLGLENMDGEDVTSLASAMEILREIDSPWFQLYPDMGSLAGNSLDVSAELRRAAGHIIGVQRIGAARTWLLGCLSESFSLNSGIPKNSRECERAAV